MSFFSSTEKYLGVDIGADGIKLVELHKEKNRPQLWTYGIIDSDTDIHGEALDKMSSNEVAPGDKMEEKKIEKYSSLLKILLQKSKVTTKLATASLPVSKVFHAVVTLPKDSEKEFNRHLEAKIKKILPRPIEEMQILHQRLPEKDDARNKIQDIRVLVTAAPISLINIYSEVFKRAGLQLTELETEAFALARSLVGQDKNTVMIVDVGALRTNFFIVDDGVPMTHRSLQIGGRLFDEVIENTLGVSQEEATQIKRDLMYSPTGLNSTVFVHLLDPLIKEVEYNFDLFLNQSGNENKKPDKVILTGGASLLPVIAAEMSRSLPVKVFVGDPWARVIYQQGLKRIIDKLGPRMAVSIGLGLRNIV